MAIVADFGWILVVQGGKLAAFNLNEMIPTSDTSTWLMVGKLQAVKMSPADHNVSFVRIGYTKDRLMGTSFSYFLAVLINSGLCGIN
jgi:hypothetical protein